MRYWMPSASSRRLALSCVKPMMSGILTSIGPLLTLIWMMGLCWVCSVPAIGSWLMTRPFSTVEEGSSVMTMR